MASVQTNRAAGLSSATAIKGPCKVATTANVVLSGLQTIDTVVLTENTRVLVKSNTDAKQNGIYYASAGVWARSPDFFNDDDVRTGAKIYVTGGATGFGDYILTSADPITIGTSNITFAAYSTADATAAAASAAASASSAAAAAASAALIIPMATAIHAATTKALPIDADELGYWDSVSAALRKLTFANLRTWLEGYFSAPIGQCRFSAVSVTVGRLAPFGGDKIKISGKLYAIPSVGVDLAAAGLTVGTTYNVYVYMNGAVMTLEASVTAHSKDNVAGNVGVEIKTGDNTRTLVGKVLMVAGPNFADNSVQRYVISWFNRKSIYAWAASSGNYTSTSTTYVEINAALKANFLTWGEDDVIATCCGASYGPATATVGIGISFDGAAPTFASIATEVTGNYDLPFGLAGAWSLTEGLHYTSIFGKATSGTWGVDGGGAISNNNVLLRG